MSTRRACSTLVAISAAFFLSACSTIGSLFFGDTETEGQHLYRIGHELAYAQILVGAIVAHPAADTGIARELCAAAARAHGKWAESMASFAATGARTPPSVVEVAKTIGKLGQTVAVAVVKIPTNPAGALAKGIEKAPLIATIAEAGREARRFRKDVAKPAVEELVAEGRDPTADEWAAIRGTVEDQRAAIVAACGA